VPPHKPPHANQGSKRGARPGAWVRWTTYSAEGSASAKKAIKTMTIHTAGPFTGEIGEKKKDKVKMSGAVPSRALPGTPTRGYQSAVKSLQISGGNFDKGEMGSLIPDDVHLGGREGGEPQNLKRRARVQTLRGSTYLPKTGTEVAEGLHPGPCAFHIVRATRRTAKRKKAETKKREVGTGGG